MTAVERDFTTGPLSRLAESVHRHAVLGLCLAIAGTPTLLASMFLGSATRGLAWIVIAQLPVAPALSAGLYAVRGWRRDDDAGPAHLFWRGYRRNTVDVLRWWVPVLALLFVLATNALNPGAVSIGPSLQVVSLAAGAVILLWSGHALVTSSFFTFRTRDVVRIAIVEMFSQWRVTLVYLSLLIVAAGVMLAGTEVALLVLAWGMVSVLEHVSRPVRADVARRFTIDG